MAFYMTAHSYTEAGGFTPLLCQSCLSILILLYITPRRTMYKHGDLQKAGAGDPLLHLSDFPLPPSHEAPQPQGQAEPEPPTRADERLVSLKK